MLPRRRCACHHRRSAASRAPVYKQTWQLFSRLPCGFSLPRPTPTDRLPCANRSSGNSCSTSRSRLPPSLSHAKGRFRTICFPYALPPTAHIPLTYALRAVRDAPSSGENMLSTARRYCLTVPRFPHRLFLRPTHRRLPAHGLSHEHAALPAPTAPPLAPASRA